MNLHPSHSEIHIFFNGTDFNIKLIVNSKSIITGYEYGPGERNPCLQIPISSKECSQIEM